MHFIHENINIFRKWRPLEATKVHQPKFTNGHDELIEILYIFWDAQKYSSFRVLLNLTLWPQLEDHLASNEPP